MLRRFTTLSRPKQVTIVAGVLAYGIAGVAGGCGAYRRPPALTGEERELLRQDPLPYSVTVAWWDEETKTGQSAEAYGDSLARVVIASRAFKTTRYDRSPAPTGQDLVATSTGLYCNTAIVPALSIISVGIIPTIFEDEHCEGMLLRRAAGQPKASGVPIDARAKGPVVMGWIAVIVGALPGWSWGSIDEDPRFAERFRLEVIRRRAEIERLVR